MRLPRLPLLPSVLLLVEASRQPPLQITVTSLSGYSVTETRSVASGTITISPAGNRAQRRGRRRP